jgi:hypothetical protein
MGWSRAALALCACFLLAPTAAFAEDANTVPPDVELHLGGEPDGIFGPKESEFGASYENLAFFETTEPDPSWAYKIGSTVSFSCLLDGQPTECPVELEPCCEARRLRPLRPARICRRKQDARDRRRPCRPRPISETAPEATPDDGPFRGIVPVPSGLAPGSHTLTVIASDEDGVDPAPPSVTIYLDTTPPSTPTFLRAPPRISRNGKPNFRFTASDDHVFPSEGDHPGIYYPAFDASLRRLRPRGPTRQSSSPFGSYVSLWRERCLTAAVCSASAQPVYSSYAGRGLWFGIPELLSPGLYEFRVQARDAVGNESPVAKRRFKVLPERR